MNTARPRTGFRTRQSILLLFVLAAAGCKNTSGDRTGLLPRSRDPIMGADRIPPAGVPVPGKEGYGAAPRDPLFKGTSASTAGSAKEPFRLTEEFTPAAMSIRGTDHSEPLIIDDRRPTGTPTGSVRPAVAAVPVGNWEQMVDELRRAGGKPYAPIKLPTGEYEFRCGVPIDTSGAVRQYTGIGATPLAAVSDVYEQVRSERK